MRHTISFALTVFVATFTLRAEEIPAEYVRGDEECAGDEHPTRGKTH